MDPAYGVTANWEIEDVQVRKLSKDESQPWGGTIQFRINVPVPGAGRNDFPRGIREELRVRLGHGARGLDGSLGGVLPLLITCTASFGRASYCR